MNEREVFTRVNKVPKNINVIDFRWVFKIKRDNEGNIDKYQQYGENYKEIFLHLLNKTHSELLLQ